MTGLSVLTGETVAPSQSLFTLVASDEWFAVANFRETDLAQIAIAVANFRETDLAQIAIGDCATVYSMIDRGQAMRGKVVGIGAGVLDGDRVNLPHSLPLVQRSVNWVRWRSASRSASNSRSRRRSGAHGRQRGRDPPWTGLPLARLPAPGRSGAAAGAVPGRGEMTLRLTVICALTALVASAYGTPEAALSVYIAFFLIRSDRVLSAILPAMMLLLVSVILGVILLVTTASIDYPILRVSAMALLSAGFLFLASASKLRPSAPSWR